MFSHGAQEAAPGCCHLLSFGCELCAGTTEFSIYSLWQHQNCWGCLQWRRRIVEPCWCAHEVVLDGAHGEGKHQRRASFRRVQKEGRILGRTSLIQPSLTYWPAFPCKQSTLKNIPCLQHIYLSSVNFHCPGATRCNLAIKHHSELGAVPKSPRSSAWLHQTRGDVAQPKCAAANGSERNLQPLVGKNPTFIQSVGLRGPIFVNAVHCPTRRNGFIDQKSLFI